MLVCHCEAQSERAIRRHIKDGAHDEEEIAARCGAGAACGGCMPALRELLARELGDKAPLWV